MKRLFIELTPECEVTAIMYARGLEKREIAKKKCRALSTISNQIQRVFEILGVRNGRELANVVNQRERSMENAE